MYRWLLFQWRLLLRLILNYSSFTVGFPLAGSQYSEMDRVATITVHSIVDDIFIEPITKKESCDCYLFRDYHVKQINEFNLVESTSANNFNQQIILTGMVRLIVALPTAT